jgi:hypothetical protein
MLLVGGERLVQCLAHHGVHEIAAQPPRRVQVGKRFDSYRIGEL